MVADFELIRLKWAEKARLNAEREALLSELETVFSPELADQVQAIMTSMKDQPRGPLSRVQSKRVSAEHAADFSDVQTQRTQVDSNPN
jgi:hypothetical protein